jgi:hypothetical protein
MYKELFSSITFGELQSYGTAAAFPLMSPLRPGALDYLMLVDAINQMLLRVEEVSEAGSVPELKVVNDAPLPVLMLSGEELRGARQNRTMNTTLLVPAKSEMIIPVSCTERGRWSYNSPDLKDSGNISSKDVRGSIFQSVRDSLERERSYRSDQAVVWNEIEMLHMKSDSHFAARTRAMDDAFKAKGPELEDALQHFPLVPGQTGIFFFFSGRVAGLDVLSKPEAYARVHGKLVRSYLIDCLSLMKAEYHRDQLLGEAKGFMNAVQAGKMKMFKSAGMGNDHRLIHPVLNGSILEQEGEAIHACCFSAKSEEYHMADFSRRRVF